MSKFLFLPLVAAAIATAAPAPAHANIVIAVNKSSQQMAVSVDGGRTYRELVRQEFNFSPPGTTFEREDWEVTAEGVTHFRLWIRPDKGGKPCRGTITSLVLR